MVPDRGLRAGARPGPGKLQENSLRWEKAGITVERMAINRGPQHFMANATIVDLLTREEV